MIGWLERASVRARCRLPLRGRRGPERGSQSLEWVGLGMVVMAIMAAAFDVARSHGGVVGQSLVDSLSKSLQPSR